MRQLLRRSLVLVFLFALFNVFANEDSPAKDGPLLTRQFDIDTARMLANLRRLSPPQKDETNNDLLRRYFKTQKIELDAPQSLFLTEKKGLIVRATAQNMARIERVIAEKLNRSDSK